MMLRSAKKRRSLRYRLQTQGFSVPTFVFKVTKKFGLGCSVWYWPPCELQLYIKAFVLCCETGDIYYNT